MNILRTREQGVGGLTLSYQAQAIVNLLKEDALFYA